MPDGTELIGGAIRRQRVDAAARVSFGCRDGRTVLERLAQRGSAKAMLPRVHRADPEVVFLNTAGGLTGGDRIAFDLALAAGARVVATTQTAERAYASLPETGPARMDVRFRLGTGARLDWLPQETILFDRAALHRRTEIDLAGDAACLLCEMLVLGRAAMGERVQTLDLTDWRAVRRDSRPVLLDPVRITTDTLWHRVEPALLAGAVAVATVALIAADAPDRIARIRPLLGTAPGRAAMSGWDGKLVVRALSPDANALRRWLFLLLTDLRGAPLPRVWSL